ncbi:MAG: hypothetical protein Q9198_010735 [Flavoplaca austrocitrina]
MPSLTRKRGAPADSSSITPIKRARRANRDNNESDRDESNLDIKSEHTTLQETNIKPARTKRSKVVPFSNDTDQLGGKDTATQEINQKAEIHDKATKTSSKRSGNSVKAQKLPAKVGEEDVKAQSTPKKARKRKAADHKEEADPPGTEPIPKKAKGKRKTKQEKEAEAMPLAVRTTGLRMFIGAHVSGAKDSGNAFALFLKSQRKWENPPLQDEHRDGFKSNCVEHKYDATKYEENICPGPFYPSYSSS